MALGVKNGPISIYDRSSSISEMSSFYKSSLTFLSEKKINIPCITLDSFCQEKGVDRIDFLWFDLEGAELEVLQASPNILNRIKVIHTETNHFDYKCGSPNYDTMREFLESQGFKLLAHWYIKNHVGDAIFIKELDSKPI